MYGTNAIIIIFFQQLKTADLIEYFVILNHYLKKEQEISVVFGLLINDSIKIIRKKIKEKIIKDFSEEDLVLLFSGANQEVFYSPTPDLDYILGIEIRFKNDISGWFNREEEAVILLREVGEQKKKIFLKNER